MYMSIVFFFCFQSGITPDGGGGDGGPLPLNRVDTFHPLSRIIFIFPTAFFSSSNPAEKQKDETKQKIKNRVLFDDHQDGSDW